MNVWPWATFTGSGGHALLCTPNVGAMPAGLPVPGRPMSQPLLAMFLQPPLDISPYFEGSPDFVQQEDAYKEEQS